MRIFRSAGNAVTGFFCFFIAFSAAADSNKKQVYFAGFAFTGENQYLSEMARHSDRIMGGDGLETINAALISALEKQPPQYLTLESQTQGRLDGTTSTIVMAAALDRETISIEPLGNQHKLLVELGFQALFFDFTEKQVIASYPITLQYIDLLDTYPVDSQIESVVAGLLTGQNSGSLPIQLAETLAYARLPEASLRRLQVGPVSISDAAAGRLPGSVKSSAIADSLAQELTKAISSATGIGLLPPASGNALGGAMSARFADGRVYQLNIPEADYRINFQLDGLRHGTVEETAAMKTLLFGAFFNISVTEPLSGKEYFNQPLRRGASKVVPSTQQGIDYWAAYQETTLSGLRMFAATAAADPASKAWLAEQKPGGRVLGQHAKSLQELIASCR